MATKRYEGPNGAIHEIDPKKFGEERLAYQIDTGLLKPAGASSGETKEKPLSAMTNAELDEVIADNALSGDLVEMTPKAVKAEAIESALADGS